jgi:cell cycle control protein 50
VYYKLTNFFQNHRSYVKSRSEKQLRAFDIHKASNLKDCDPLVTFGDWDAPKNSSLDRKVLYPCGLVANSFFTDIIHPPCILPLPPSPQTCVPLAPPECAECTDCDGCRNWMKKGIAWPSDLDEKFINRPLTAGETRESPVGFKLPQINDEDLVVWMRAASFPNFSKLYRYGL